MVVPMDRVMRLLLFLVPLTVIAPMLSIALPAELMTAGTPAAARVPVPHAPGAAIIAAAAAIFHSSVVAAGSIKP